MRHLLLLALAPFLLTACAESDEPDDKATVSTKTSSASPTTPATEDTEQGSEEPAADAQGEILDSGFGQGKDEYVWVTAIVKNLADFGGQTVTVNFNLYDDAHELLGSYSQVDSFDIGGQTMAVGTQMDVARRERVATMEATLLVEDSGVFDEIEQDLGTAEGEIYKEPYGGGWGAKFTIHNPTDEPLQNLGIGVACKDEQGNINGGGMEFPELIPPSGEVLIKPYLIVSSEPESCTAYIGGPIY